jgi:hypothetical protein
MFLLDIAESAEVVRGIVGWTNFDAADGTARVDALAARKRRRVRRPSRNSSRPESRPFADGRRGLSMCLDGLIGLLASSMIGPATPF